MSPAYSMTLVVVLAGALPVLADVTQSAEDIFGEAVGIEHGRGVAKNEVEAARLHRLAAEMGHARAQNNLGSMYREGRGVAKNERDAVRWYSKAAQQGNARAQYNLAVMYEYGLGAAKDIPLAAFWYRKAAGQGIAEARDRLAVLEKLEESTPSVVAAPGQPLGALPHGLRWGAAEEDVRRASAQAKEEAVDPAEATTLAAGGTRALDFRDPVLSPNNIVRYEFANGRLSKVKVSVLPELTAERREAMTKATSAGEDEHRKFMVKMTIEYNSSAVPQIKALLKSRHGQPQFEDQVNDSPTGEKDSFRRVQATMWKAAEAQILLAETLDQQGERGVVFVELDVVYLPPAGGQ